MTSEPDVVDDKEVGSRPGLETLGVGVVGESGVEVGEQIDAASVPEGDGLRGRSS